MKISTILVVIPLAVLATLIAVANRDSVVFRLNPLSPGDTAYTFTMPLFALVFLTFSFGALVGGIAVTLRRWRMQRRQKQAAKEAAKEAAAAVPLDAGKDRGSQSAQ